MLSKVHLTRIRKPSEQWMRVVLMTIFIKMTCGVLLNIKFSGPPSGDRIQEYVFLIVSPDDSYAQ